MKNSQTHPDRPPRITPFQNHPLYFITFNTHNRQTFLANTETHRRFITFAENSAARGAAIGRYVLMPDHIHLFLRCHESLKIGDTIRLMKRSLSAAIKNPAPHWQPGFFDHILRQSESYAEKWRYVEQNPVRAGLVENPADWPFKGEIVELRM